MEKILHGGSVVWERVRNGNDNATSSSWLLDENSLISMKVLRALMLG